MAVLKNIIFDLGGVLLSIDYIKTENAFKALGYTDFKKMYSQFTADELFVKLETGKISNNDFLQVLTAAHAKEVTEQQITDAWNSMLLEWREESLSFLKQLSAHYKTFLLSNTNAVHEEAFNRSLNYRPAWFQLILFLRRHIIHIKYIFASRMQMLLSLF